jgi:hypothetical protein
MTNIEFLRNRVKLNIRDQQVSDEDIDEIIINVINDIAVDTHIFKKLYGFSVHKEMTKYNFKYIARLNERVEREPTEIYISAPPPEEILKFLSTGELPDPTVTKDLQIEDATSLLIDVVSIIDDEGYNISSKFKHSGSSYYYVTDTEWLELYDDRNCVFVANVVPDIDELAPEDLVIISKAVVAGSKFYITDRMQSPNDLQSTNYNYQRYYQATEGLKKLFPTYVIGNINRIEDYKWL